MIKKYYQVVCDKCGNTICDYHVKPTKMGLKDMDVTTIKGKHYCSDCEKESE